MLLLKLVYFVVLIQAATQCACLAMLIPTHGRRSDPKSLFHSSDFSFLVTYGDEIDTKIQKYYVIFVYILQDKMGKTEKKQERKSHS